MITEDKFLEAMDGLEHNLTVLKKNQETLSSEELHGKYAKAYETLKKNIWKDGMMFLWAWLTESRPFLPGDKTEQAAYYAACKGVADTHMEDFVRVLYQHPDKRDFYNLVAQIVEETAPLYSPYWLRECIIDQGQVYNRLDRCFWDEESQKWRRGNYCVNRWVPPIELRMQVTAPMSEKRAG